METKKKHIAVICPGAQPVNVRLSSIEKVVSLLDSAGERVYLLRYKSGRMRRIDRASALAVFDALQPTLFE